MVHVEPEHVIPRPATVPGHGVGGTGIRAPGPDSIESTAPNDEEAIVSSALPKGQMTRCTVDDVCAMLGVPARDWKSFARWAAVLCDQPARGSRETAVNQTVDAVHAYVDVLIAERCAHPTDDLLSELIGADIGGDGFTADELRLSVTTLMTMASTYERRSARR
jgi:cytochrome P450